MSRTDMTFDQRLRRVTRKHMAMARSGVRYRMGRDGLVSAVPRRRGPAFPLRGLVLLVAAAFLFKGFLLAWLGNDLYAERVAMLQSGSVFEQAGAWVMQADPATVTIAGVIRPYLY